MPVTWFLRFMSFSIRTFQPAARNTKETFVLLLLTLWTDVNPPVHAWSVFRVFKIERKLYGRSDLDFLGETLDIYGAATLKKC